MKRIILLILCTYITLASRSVNYNFQFRHYSIENGVSANSVRAIMQDGRGYIWFGTDEGLNRFDGITVKKCRFCSRDADQYVSCLYDAGTAIWVGTGKGIFLYTHATESASPLRIKTHGGTDIHTNVNNITCDKDGNIWISTMGQGAFRYSPRRHLLEQYHFRGTKERISHIMTDSENRVWAISNWGTPAVWRFDRVCNQFIPVRLIGAKAADYRALTMSEDSEGNIWLGTWEHGLMRIDSNGSTETWMPSGMGSAAHIHSITEYAPHMLLIGSDDGLVLFNTITRHAVTYKEDETNPMSISNRFVYPVVKDREGGVWIGTFYGGVNYIAPNAGRFAGYAISKLHNSVNGNVINRFCEDGDGNIWIASDDGVLNCLSAATGRFTNYMPHGNRNSLSYHNVHALCMDGTDLWIGTYTGGINVMNTRTGRFRYYNYDEGNVRTPDGTSCYAIFRDRHAQIWATSMDGVNRYDRKKDDFVRVKKLNAMTIDIDQDERGYIWFATQGNGLFRYDTARNMWRHYKHGSGTNTIQNDQVNCVSIDANGQMWVATMGGLCRYDRRHDCFTRVNIDIPNHNINCIIEDDHALWLTTNNGLVRYAPGEPCRVYTKRDGLQNDQFLPNAGIKASDGRIFIGTVNGFNAFYPYQIRTNKMAPKVYITGLEIFNKSIDTGSERLPMAPDCIKKLNLSYRDNVFSLLFASLSYCTPEKNQYAYRLDGFDKQWNYVGSQNRVTYTNLSPGTYVFHVKATNNDGVWSNADTTLEIVIHPPFYLTLPMKILYTALLITLIASLAQYMARRTEKRHAEEIRLINENKELEVRNAKINFFTMIAHEIRTPVTLIIGPLENIMKPTSAVTDAIREDLNIIDRNAHRLLYLVNQLLDFRKVEQKNLVMKFTAHNINRLMHAVSERFEPSINRQGAKLDVTYPDENFTAIVDSEAITKVISNLLTNAGKYTKDYVALSCHVNPNGNTFAISVTDNGTGIRPEDQQKIFQPFYQAMDNKPGTGIGLSIVKNIVDLHHGMLEVESEPDKGSTFTVTLPAMQKDVIIGDENPLMPMESYIRTSPTDAATNDEDRDTMLIVDDNEDMVKFISNNFCQHYNVLSAGDGIEALDRLRQNRVTMIVSDWMMPRMSGEQLCRAVRADQNTSHIPFIMLTAKTDNDSKVGGMDCGADAYIEKPFSMEYLEACIKNMIELRRMLRDKFSSKPLEPVTRIAGNPVDDDFLLRMQKIIEDNFSNPDLSVNFLADRLCISRSGLFAKIKSLAAITPNEMIQMIRLKRAAILIADGKYHANEICYMVGFNNPSYFSKCFQKQFGVTPGDFAHNGM